MSTIRGRAVKVGGQARDPQGATGRMTTGATGQDAVIRPAFRTSAQVIKPIVPAQFTGWLDPGGVSFWRMVFVLAATGYILGWHVKLGRLRIAV